MMFRSLAPLAGGVLALLAAACSPAKEGAGPSNDDGEDEGAGGAAGTGGAGGGAPPGGNGGGGTGGTGGSGGTGAVAGAGGTGAAGSGGQADAAVASTPDAAAVEAGRDQAAPPSDAVSQARFSFFVTSLEAMRPLSGSQDGFGGNLPARPRPAPTRSAARSPRRRPAPGTRPGGPSSAPPGGPDGGPVHAIERIGDGPWYDRRGGLVAQNREGLIRARPAGDPQTVADLPNEKGEIQERFGDNHDTVTASNKQGMLASTDPGSTCNDWTSASPQVGTGGKILIGHSWPRARTDHWISQHSVPGCAPGVNLVVNTVKPGNCLGCNGGYGGFYCFALTP